MVTTKKKKTNRKKKPCASTLVSFLSSGGAMSEVFYHNIRSFLSVVDMVACAATCRELHRLCRTYTVPDLLDEWGIDLGKTQRIMLGTQIMNTVKSYHPSRLIPRPGRVVCLGDECFWAKLYHPLETDQIACIVKGAGIQKPPRMCLVSATFDAPGKVRGAYDVTKILTRLIRRQGKSWLELKPPPMIGNGRGGYAKMPVTFRYWYTRFFGDPCPNVTKVLTIRAKDMETGRMVTNTFGENTYVKLKLFLKEAPK